MSAEGLIRLDLEHAERGLSRALSEVGSVSSPNEAGKAELRRCLWRAGRFVEHAQIALAQLPGVAGTPDTFSHGGGI